MTKNKPFKSLNIVVLTVSDSRDESNNTAGDLLADALVAEGHQLSEKVIATDDIYQIRALTSVWIASTDVQVVLVTGGTGFNDKNATIKALTPLFDKTVEGFGELFRQLSFDDIGTSTLQSRAVAGLANGTVIFCMPGSIGACQLGWDKIIQTQLDARHGPCNFVPHLK
ncbi:molybdenum cofactor biosynthesis protein B [Shewanella surugensis]|uniref:Molybdenum cofactor biosynthesis protein B n=1 Tax=Shewanella surugensis TaxID=212020 RepID=A0ABT0LBK4_9GAMM|nr:molybdenum cofactor biosynthesis protein B [Shewanella surugensis]MCL1125087.1 molybdenum cofactor biosynthesis protein B [Shewanella surugensis]